MEALQTGEPDPLTPPKRQQLDMFLNRVADGDPQDGEGCGSLCLLAKGGKLSSVDLELQKRSGAPVVTEQDKDLETSHRKL